MPEIMPPLDDYLVKLYMTGKRTKMRDFNSLTKAVSALLEAGGSRALHTALGSAGPAAMAVGPWIAAAKVARRSSTASLFIDMLPPGTSSGGKNLYRCSCGKCAASVRYLSDRHDVHTTAVATTVFTAGIAMAAKIAHRASSGVSKKRQEVARQLQLAALPDGHSSVKLDKETAQPYTVYESVGGGCRKAQAAIAILFGEHSKEIGSYKRTCAAIVATDGWMKIRDRIA